MSSAIVRVENLSLGFETEGGFVDILDDVSFAVDRGERFALVGESGCGKSALCLALTRLHPTPPARYTGGRILVNGEDVLAMSPRALRRLRGGTVAYVFQEPSVSLNPVLRVGTQIAENLALHDRRGGRRRAAELLELVGIPDPARLVKAYPCELSGGMQQRVMIAMALSGAPAVLVADEPTTALDVTVQAQILELLARLRDETAMSLVLVTHNLGIVAGLADRVAVMYAGQIVETAPVSALLRSPRHPYTAALLRAVPTPGRRERRLGTIPGRVPSPWEYGEGCRFAGRCARVQDDCRQPGLATRDFGDGHLARCLHPE